MLLTISELNSEGNEHLVVGERALLVRLLRELQHLHDHAILQHDHAGLHQKLLHMSLIHSEMILLHLLLALGLLRGGGIGIGRRRQQQDSQE